MNMTLLPKKAVADLLSIQRIIIGMTYKDAVDFFRFKECVIREGYDFNAFFDLNYGSLTLTIFNDKGLCGISGSVEYHEEEN